MRRSPRLSAIVLICSILPIACSNPAEKPASNMAAARQAKAELDDLRSAMKKIEPFYKRMGMPARHDWLASHTEPGQTFEEFLDLKQTRPRDDRQKIYLLPLGKLNASQQEIVDTATGFLSAFYDLPIDQLPARALDIPAAAVRRKPSAARRQIRSGYILDEVLVPILPADGLALLAFTTEDLYPNDSMNYVFGEARLEKKVGVWSLDRLDDNTDKRNYLVRALKISAHEAGHMFGMRHCTKYECVMSGTNNLSETDRRPIDTCPECTAKISWYSKISLAERYKRLAEYCRRIGLSSESKEFEAKLKAI